MAQHLKSAAAYWIKTYANWGAAVLFVIALFSAVIAGNFAIPLTLFVAAVSLFAYRNWTAIRHFDIWAVDEWFRTRVDAIGIRDWHSPYHAAETCCSTAVVMARNEAAANMNSIMMEMVKGDTPSRSVDASPHDKRHLDYDAAQIRFNQCNEMLARQLLLQLTHGDLIAKGLLVDDDKTKSERIIPTSQWRVMSLDIAKAEASGHGWHYIGVVIGKKPPKPQPEESARSRLKPPQPVPPQPAQQAHPRPEQQAWPQPAQQDRPQPGRQARPQQGQQAWPQAAPQARTQPVQQARPQPGQQMRPPPPGRPQPPPGVRPSQPARPQANQPTRPPSKSR